MKRISFTERNRSGNLLHIEVPGAIVNIRVGLTDRLGRRVTSIMISPDDQSRSPDGEGRYWRLADDRARVIQDLVPASRIPAEPSPDARECRWCGADIEQGGDGLWADVAEMPDRPGSMIELPMDAAERLACPVAPPRSGGYPGLHEPSYAGECATCGRPLDRTGISGRDDEFIHADEGPEDHLPVPLFGPHDIRGWEPREILLGVYAGAELWDSLGGSDPADELSDRQRELLDAAAAAMPGEEEFAADPDYDKTTPFRTWDTGTLTVTLRAAGILWESLGRTDPYDVLSSIQCARLDRATRLVVTAEDHARLAQRNDRVNPDNTLYE